MTQQFRFLDAKFRILHTHHPADEYILYPTENATIIILVFYQDYTYIFSIRQNL